MSTAATFYKKVLKEHNLAQVIIDIAVLEPYLTKSSYTVKRTNSVGRIKASSWSFDFGISPDEKHVHISLTALGEKLPESERAHWLSHIDGSPFSDNFLKMQSSHACIDDGNLREWGEEAEEDSLFD
jgi:hypothetical protein